MPYAYTHTFEVTTSEFSLEGELNPEGGPDAERINMPANELTVHQLCEVMHVLDALMGLQHCSSDIIKVELVKKP